MLPSKNVLNNKDIETVKKEGYVLQSDSFGVIVAKRKEKDLPRFGFVVSTKISKLAVHRNRVRRALAEATRRNLVEVPAGTDVVFLAKKEIASRSTEEIMRETADFLRKTDF